MIQNHSLIKTINYAIYNGSVEPELLKKNTMLLKNIMHSYIFQIKINQLL